MKFFILFFLPLLLISCTDSSINEVKHYGALRDIMGGNLETKISLDSLSDLPNLYALGAHSQLKGEIQIFNSKAINSHADEGRIAIKKNFNADAALLVYAQVDQWESIEIDHNVDGLSELEKLVEREADKLGIDTDKPFPFLIEGQVQSLNWHVIDWPAGDQIHTHQKHKETGLNGTINNSIVQILGFYSTKHKGVFTHHSTLLHMHFKKDDGTLAGHVDALKLLNSFTLKLPKT